MFWETSFDKYENFSLSRMSNASHSIICRKILYNYSKKHWQDIIIDMKWNSTFEIILHSLWNRLRSSDNEFGVIIHHMALKQVLHDANCVSMYFVILNTISVNEKYLLVIRSGHERVAWSCWTKMFETVYINVSPIIRLNRQHVLI